MNTFVAWTPYGLPNLSENVSIPTYLSFGLSIVSLRVPLEKIKCV